jgi:RND family efflux transporter MFP subunit
MLTKKNNGGVLFKLGLVLVVLAGAAAALMLGFQATARVEPVKRDTAVDAVTGSARVDADGGLKELKLDVPGVVAWCEALDPNRKFKAGEKLLQLDTSEIDRRIAETQRTHEDAKRRAKILRDNNPERKVAKETLDNAIRLRDRGDVSDENVRALERALAAIDTRLQLADFDEKKADVDFNVMMDDMKILRDKMTKLAPDDGVIEGALTWKGALITAGQTVATFFSNKRVVTVKISEESFGKVRIGQPARLRLLTYGTQSFEATVSKLHPTADDAQRFTVFLDVKVDDQEKLLRGSTGEATITVDQRPNQVMIRRRALIDNDRVLVVKNGRVERRKVEVGYVALNVVEIRQGLEVGEQIIVDRLDDFRDGQRVRAEVVK